MTERLRLVAWKRLRKASLIGFAEIWTPLGCSVIDVPVNISHGKAWASMPAKPQIDTQGRAIRNERGKIAYSAMHRWDTPRLRDAFSERVVELVRLHDPDAFEPAGDP